MTPRNLILILSAGGFASTFSSRAVEPMVGIIARDFATSPQTIALLSAAFALPYAFIQPVLGPVGDALGKERVIKVALALLLATLVGAMAAPDTTTLFVLRIISGAAAGGAVPLSLALIGDRVAMEDRQVALSRYLVAVIVGQLGGSSLAGLMAEVVGWRGVFGISAGMTAAALGATMIGFRGAARGGRFDFAGALSRYRDILSMPRAVALFAFVFVEACALFGVFPYIAPLLELRGEGPSLAGLIIGGFAVGGLIYAAIVGWLLRRFGIYRILVIGGLVAGAALVALGQAGRWQTEALAMLGMGLGFYMLHNTFQAQVTEVFPKARASTVALHAFSFFCGQALSVVIMGAGIRGIGFEASTTLAAIVIVGVGATAAYVLSRPDQPLAR